MKDGQTKGPRRKPAARPPQGGWERWASEPRGAVLFILFSVLFLGGGRKLLQARRARGAVDRLADEAVTPEAIAEAAGHGRAGLMELFRILGSAPNEGLRDAAGHSLSVLWARDELIAEEEKALVRYGFRVDWKARRRYPRGLQSAVPVAVSFGVPFLRGGGPGVGPESLEWSYRVVGARRASLEEWGAWVAGPGRAEFQVIPSDFETDGPHKLALQARVRTRGLTDPWELELPHVPFSFEFDPRLDTDALLALPDDARAAAIARAVRLVSGIPSGENEPPRFLDLDETMSIRGTPEVEVSTPLPCDLAHVVELEFEGVAGRFAAGVVVLSGQGGSAQPAPSGTVRVPLGPVSAVPPGAIPRPGPRRVRARLVPDPDLGWADPETRSLWPGTIETGWADVEIVRR